MQLKNVFFEAPNIQAEEQGTTNRDLNSVDSRLKFGGLNSSH